ncbi:MAG: hypothetical protein HY868_22120 [Chloroflexi bacterium]|nr:hypothetical protein [Chloroflexota bacterium]
MNRTEWTILGVLSVCIVVVFCLLGVFILNTLPGTTGERESAMIVPSATPDRATPTPRSTWTPTSTRTPAPTATWVIQRPATAPPPTAVYRLPTRKPTVRVPTRTRVPGPIQDGWDKTAKAQALRFDMNMTLAGDIWNLPGASGHKVEFSYLSFSGESQGKDNHFVMKGYLIDLLIPSPKGLEMITVGNQVYLRGPVPMLGASEAKWYVDTATNLYTASSLRRPEDWIGYGYGNPDWSSFKKAATESLDNKRCDVYRADKTATQAWLRSVNPEDILNPDTSDNMDDAEIKVWLCDDGFAHQFRMILATHSKYDPQQKGKVQMQMHFYDLNGNVKISAPANATPLNLPKAPTDKTL